MKSIIILLFINSQVHFNIHIDIHMRQTPLNQLLSNQGLERMSIYGHNCEVFCILVGLS